MRRLPLPMLSLGLVALLWAAPARADLVLSFNSPTYTTQVGQNVAVQVLLTQTPAGTQVDSLNTLLGTGVQVTFNTPPGIASVQSIVGGPAWDATSTSPTPSTTSPITFANSSLLGIGTIPGSGLLLATITFQGLSPGVNVLNVRTLTPGASFPTASGAFLDPTTIGTATLTVLVPEPASIIMAVTGLGAVIGGAAWRRARGRSTV